MSLVMTPEEREAFLAEVHVGVLAVARDGRGPLAVPIWYDYRDGEILLWMDRDSLKHRCLRAAGRFSFAVQDETPPYRYVSVEGPVTALDETATRAQVRAMAGRYLPAAEAESFVDSSLGTSSVLVRLRPERWLSNDFSKA